MANQYKEQFEKMLCTYCGPALAGIKPANMICIKKEKLPLFQTLLLDYNNTMNRHDIYFFVINETETCYLLLVYRMKKLYEHLNNGQVKSQLMAEGYTDTENIESLIHELRERFAKSHSLPDEIGLFLGYPMEDIKGFKEHKGKNSLISKYWKVYSNVNETQKMFDRYDKCKAALCSRLSQGMSLIDIFSKTVA